MIKSGYFKFIGQFLLFFYVIGLLTWLVNLVQLANNDSGNLGLGIILFIVYLIFTPALGLLFISHANLIDQVDSNSLTNHKIPLSGSNTSGSEWVCECGNLNKSGLNECLNCGKKRN